MSNYKIKPWESLTIQDDYMFKLIMRRKRICKKMLEKILKIKIHDIKCPIPTLLDTLNEW